jgi:hypothetical protein
MQFGRRPNTLYRVENDLHFLAPIPFVYHISNAVDLSDWHHRLMSAARKAFSEPVLEVPDVRHVHRMGSPPQFSESTWSEEQIPAVGVWHRVPTNGFLGLDVPDVCRLKKLIESQYVYALGILDGKPGLTPWISESWIQFYKAGDYKVLHNHERYGPPYPHNRWAGAYYIDDGAPDPTMPYSGLISFRVRQANHFVRPQPGMLLMWPADILHEVHPFYGERERVVVNFNINSEQAE